MFILIKEFIYYFLLLPHVVLYMKSKNRRVIDEDINRWKEAKNKEGSNVKLLLYFLTHSADFRTIFYYRTRGVIASLLNLYCKKQQNFTIDVRTKIKGGILTGHPYSTILNAKSIGENFYVNHLVTVGEKEGKRPVIGDNVSIFAGAIVIGDIRIGNNSSIGAGAVVVKDVPDHSIAVGNPARIIKKQV